jgi:hypothetical protein
MLIDKFESDQKESYMKLTASLLLPPNGLPEESVFTVSNDSSNDLVVTQIVCGINKLNYGVTGDWIQNSETSVMYEGETILGLGGGKQSEACVSQSFGSVVNGIEVHPSCVDLTMTVVYRLVEQPNAQNAKHYRYSYTPARGRWISELLDHKGYYCG